MLAGTQVNDPNKLKRLIRPHMVSVGSHLCNVQLMNSNENHQNLKEAFQEMTQVVIVVGKTGTGKTSLLDTLTNFFYKVKFEDDFRYTLKSDEELQGPQVDSQTNKITAYIMRKDNQNEASSKETKFCIIDTPGFADTDGTTDTGIPDMLKRLFDEAGHPSINGICFVVKGTENRIGAAEKKLFQDVLKLFPKTAKRSTFACFTFWSFPKPSKEASEAFSQGICGDLTAREHLELTFENRQTLYGTDIPDHDLDKFAQKNLRRAKDDFEQNMDSTQHLFEAMASSSFSAKGVSDVIGSRNEATVKFYHMKVCIARTCEVITDLLQEKMRREKLRESIMEKHRDLETLRRQRLQWENAQEYWERVTQDLQERLKREEKQLTQTTDVHCLLCKKICCVDCTFPSIGKCDKMEVPEYETMQIINEAGDVSDKAVPIFGKLVKGFGSLVSVGVSVITKAWNSQRSCKECGHTAADHNLRTRETKPRRPLSLQNPVPDVRGIRLPAIEDLENPEEISQKIANQLMISESELVRFVIELREILSYLIELAWTPSDISLESCEVEISQVVREKCSENHDALTKCECLLKKAFRDAGR